MCIDNDASQNPDGIPGCSPVCPHGVPLGQRCAQCWDEAVHKVSRRALKEGGICPRCSRSYRFAEEKENRLCAICVKELIPDCHHVPRRPLDQITTAIETLTQFENSMARVIAQKGKVAFGYAHTSGVHCELADSSGDRWSGVGKTPRVALRDALLHHPGFKDLVR